MVSTGGASGDAVQPGVIVVHAVQQKAVVLAALADTIDAEVAANPVGSVAFEVAALLAARRPACVILP